MHCRYHQLFITSARYASVGTDYLTVSVCCRSAVVPLPSCCFCCFCLLLQSAVSVCCFSLLFGRARNDAIFKK
ncbi:hypothetical protein [Methanimicrococcus hacksteinii]|uniref:hypothetical protein n=1 Tax=Methanimicrococcus hacksteinii TaxID=3028293 RepID=UPI00298EE6FD|nr:hypothetical protein [Methanimicrococcus sp. At1]